MSELNNEKDSIAIECLDMGKYLADPPEYRFVDRVEVVPGKEARGEKMVSSQEWYLGMHYKDNPVMPEGFLMEAVMQTGVFIITSMPQVQDKLMMFHSCDSMEIYDIVRPGCWINTYVKLKSYRHGVARYHGEAALGRLQNGLGGVIMQMDFTLISPASLVSNS